MNLPLSFTIRFAVCLFVVSAANSCLAQTSNETGTPRSETSQDSTDNVANNNNPTVEFYDPIEKNIEGWTVAFDPRLLEESNKELFESSSKALANHLQRIEYMLPADRLQRIKQCRIWIELNNTKTKGMQYHPGRGWLLSKGLDPRLVKHVHIASAKTLMERATWKKHPYVILHELAHAYHDQVYGFNDKSIKKVFESAKKSNSYEKVLDHRGRQVRHYGMNNQMEYFAESTEAYLGVNDFYPFVRAELKEHDQKMYALMEKVWGKIE